MVAKDGLIVIIPIFLITLLAWGLWYSQGQRGYLLAPAILFTVVALFSLYFFRDPERTIPPGANLVLAPADGKVVDISEAEETFFCKKKMRKISIFLSVFNVHLNRMPVAGTVVYKQYYPGKFLDARADKASLENEQMHLGLAAGGDTVLVKQIAGLIARRVVCHAEIGQSYRAGEKFGMLRFGSRTDLFLPLSASVKVQAGQMVQGGTTIMGEMHAQ
jgi:phosphatidylserine decarboxylase